MKWISSLLAFVVVTGVAFAHNGMTHVLGTVTAITGTNITVKTTQGVSETLLLSSATKYIQGTTTVTLKEIKVGDRVVIHATKNGDQLVAAEVKAGAASPMQGNTSGMKMDHGQVPPQP